MNPPPVTKIASHVHARSFKLRIQIRNLSQSPLKKARIIFCMAKPKGKIIIPSGVSLWEYELRTTEALSAVGYVVEFIPKSEADHKKTPDALLDGLEWEMKSPVSNSLSNVQKTLRKAAHQASRIIYDSQCVKNLTDLQIECELRKQAPMLRSIKSVLFVNKKREVIDIK